MVVPAVALVIKLVIAAAANKAHARLSCVTEISAQIHGAEGKARAHAIGIVDVWREDAALVLGLLMIQQAVVEMVKGVPATLET